MSILSDDAQAKVFGEFCNSLPVLKRVIERTLCPNCYASTGEREVAVNGFSEWKYKKVENGGLHIELGNGHACVNKCWAGNTTSERRAEIAREVKAQRDLESKAQRPAWPF